MNVEHIRSMFPALSRKVYGKDLIYFDNAATSQRTEAVIREWNRISSESNANIHRAVHRLADEATQAYEEARDAVREFLNAEFREEIERLVMKNDVTYYLTLLLVFVSYLVAFLHRNSYGIEGYTVWAVCFILLVILVTMKVRIYNRILEWFGMHVFSIYILQRLPMILLDRMGLIDSHKYLCLIAVFALTIPLAIAFEKATDAVINRKAAVTPQ